MSTFSSTFQTHTMLIVYSCGRLSSLLSILSRVWPSFTLHVAFSTDKHWLARDPMNTLWAIHFSPGRPPNTGAYSSMAIWITVYCINGHYVSNRMGYIYLHANCKYPHPSFHFLSSTTIIILYRRTHAIHKWAACIQNIIFIFAHFAVCQMDLRCVFFALLNSMRVLLFALHTHTQINGRPKVFNL